MGLRAGVRSREEGCLLRLILWGEVNGASAPKASGPKRVVEKNRSWGIPPPWVQEAQAASGLPAPHFRRVFPQRGRGFTRRRLIGDTTKVNRQVTELNEMQMVYRFVRGKDSGDTGKCCSVFPDSFVGLLHTSPRFLTQERFRVVYHRHYADYTETTNGSGAEYERIGTEVRTNRNLSSSLKTAKNLRSEARSNRDGRRNRPGSGLSGAQSASGPHVRSTKQSGPLTLAAVVLVLSGCLPWRMGAFGLLLLPFIPILS